MSGRKYDRAAPDEEEIPGSDGETSSSPAKGPPFRVVAVLASAQAASSLDALLRGLGPLQDAAVVVVAVPPRKKGPSRNAGFPPELKPARAGDRLKPGSKYRVDPGDLLVVDREGFRPVRRVAPAPIDFFFETLARAFRSAVLVVVLSDTGEEAAAGLQWVKAMGGLVYAEAPEALGEGKPAAVLHARPVDRVLAAGALSRELGELLRLRWAPAGPTEGLPDEEQAFQSILRILRMHTGVDFSGYRRNTLARRIGRRVALQRIDGLAEYARYLEAHPAEVQALFDDVLIHVTSFFRDPVLFDTLRDKVFPKLIRRKAPGESIRLWVPACSTGQEVYSLAICLLEAMEKTGRTHPVQIFATDVSEAAVRKAREGLYPVSMQREVSRERLRRFFTVTAEGVRVARTLRDLCIFVTHDVTLNPSFSKLDLISCRHLLIYLTPESQQKVLQTFHLALNPQGFLVLSESETVTALTPLYEVIDRERTIYVKKAAKAAAPSTPLPPLSELLHPPVPAVIPEAAFDPEHEARRLFLSEYAPATFVVNERLDLLHFWGRVRPYLELSAGRAELNLARLLPSPLVSEIRLAVRQARHQGAPVRRGRVPVRLEEGRRLAYVQAAPVKPPTPGGAEPFYLVMIHEEAEPTALQPGQSRSRRSSPGAGRTEEEARQLREDLASTLEYSHSVIRQYERITEELRAANEEIISTNEELKSTNEELETAKEEVQSTNDELTARNRSLIELTNDLTNFVASIDLAVVMIGADGCIRRLTPRAETLLQLLPSDVGRPLRNLRLPVEIPDLEGALEEATRTGRVQHREVKGPEGRWYQAHVRPYCTAEGRIEGAVLSLVDIDEVRRREEERRALLEREREARREAETLDRIGRRLAAELDTEKLVQAVTDAATELTGAQFGALFYNRTAPGGEAYMLYALSGVPRDRFAAFPMPRNTALFGPTFRGEGIVRVDDVRKDPRYGKNPPHHGMPKGHLPVASYMAVPVVSRSGEVLGGLFFGHSEPGRFRESHERVVGAIAAQAAIALDNARLYDRAQREIEERARAEEAQRFLAEAGALLSSSLDYTKTLANLARLAVPRIADWCTVHMIEPDGVVRRLALAHTDRERERLVAEMDDRFPQPPDAPAGVPKVLRTGATELVTEIPDELLVSLAKAPEQLELWRRLGLKSFMVVPIRAQGKVLGALALVSAESGRRFGSGDVAFAENLAHRAGLAIENAGLYRQSQKELEERRRAEEALSLQKSLLESQSEASVDGILAVDSEGRIIYSNRRFAEMWRLPEDVVSSRSDEAAIRAVLDRLDDPEQFQARIRHLYRHPYERSRDELKLKNGQVFERHSAPIVSAQGALYGRVWYFRDITEQRNAERTLRRSEERFRQLTEAIHEVFYISDLRVPVMHYVSPAYEDIWGRPAQTLYDAPGSFMETVLPEDRPVVERAVERQLQGLPTRTEYRIRRPEGDLRWVWDRAYPVLDDQGKLVHVTGVAEDITERKRVEEALREKSELLRTVTDNMNAGILFLDERQRTTFINPAVTRITGHTLAEIGGKAAHDVLHHRHPDGRPFPAAECPIDRALPSGRGLENYETVFIRKDGSPVPVACSAQPILRDGTPVATVVEFRDVTEAKRANDEIRRLNEGLERLVAERTAQLELTVRELESFAYSIAHDLRAPLRAIAGNGELLLEECGAQIGDSGREAARRIIDSGKRMDQLIQDLLRYSRLTREQIPTENVDLASLVAETIQELEIEVRERRGTLTVDAPLPPVIGNRSVLKAVLQNLLVNALKFCEEGVDPRVRVWAESGQGKVRVWVEDNGIGIAPEYHERIFGVFERLHTVDRYPGTGIGLAIVRKALERLRGRSGVVSSLGQGSRFWIELPAPGADA